MLTLFRHYRRSVCLLLLAAALLALGSVRARGFRRHAAQRHAYLDGAIAGRRFGHDQRI